MTRRELRIAPLMVAFSFILLAVGQEPEPEVHSTWYMQVASRSTDVAVWLHIDRVVGQGDLRGIAGEVRYDTAYLNEPRVAVGDGCSPCLAYGQMLEPGRFRFAIYPTWGVNMNWSSMEVARFQLSVNDVSGDGSVATDVAFEFESAGDEYGNSFAPVQFSPITILIQARDNAAKGQWVKYE
jgi:hypothetical protein